MKVKFNTEELKKRLSQLGSVVAKKATVPVFSFVRLYAVQAVQEISGPKFQVGMIGGDIDAALTVVFTKAEADDTIDVLLPFAKLVEIVGNVTSAETVIEAADQTKATIKAGKFRGELKTHPLENWPSPLERPDAAIATIGLPGFKEQIENIDFAVPANDGKFVVSVARVESTAETLAVIGTDGFRLAISKAPSNVGEFNLTIPKPALELIKKLEGGQLTISEAEAGFYFETELETLTVSRSHGEFPNYKGILPKKFAVEITVKKNELLAALKRVKSMADAETPSIVFGTTDGALTLSADSTDESGPEGGVFRNTASDEVAATIAGGNVEFSLNVKLLLPFVETAFGNNDGDIVIQATDGTTVVDFHANAGQYRFLQMPTQPKVKA
jgi:DNA polymerase-3 subunit beta